MNLQAQEALEELRIAAQQAPDCSIARLKYGELLMRLRVCQRAAKETDGASLLAVNGQSELARRQATTVRTMLREGTERGYAGFVSRILGRRGPKKQSRTPVFVGTE